MLEVDNEGPGEMIQQVSNLASEPGKMSLIPQNPKGHNQSP